MLKSIIEFFETRAGSGDVPGAEKDSSSLELAAAVLMVEISMADSDLQKEERDVIKQALQNSFNLSEEDSLTVISLAEKEVDHAVSLYEFTSLLNQTMSNEEKVRIIEMLWNVAFADAVLDKYEEYYIRKISDLLYVSHIDYIKTKHKASEE